MLPTFVHFCFLDPQIHFYELTFVLLSIVTESQFVRFARPRVNRGNVEDVYVVSYDHLGHHQDAQSCVSFYFLDIYVPEIVYIWCPWGETKYLLCLIHISWVLFMYWSTTDVSLKDHDEGFILYLFTTSNIYMHITVQIVIILFWNVIVYFFVTESYYLLVGIGFLALFIFWSVVGMIIGLYEKRNSLSVCWKKATNRLMTLIYFHLAVYVLFILIG